MKPRFWISAQVMLCQPKIKPELEEPKQEKNVQVKPNLGKYYNKNSRLLYDDY
jgi:hypothetical protein